MVSVSCFGVRVSVMFHFMFVHYTFSSVCFYAPNFEKVDGAYCFWSVRAWVRAWVRGFLIKK